MPAPSPITKPSRSLSKGREAWVGSSLNLEVIAFMLPKPATPVGVMAASEPPAIMASAWPRRNISKLSPSACAPVAQAVTTVEFGPFAPVKIEIWPAAMSAIIIGISSGETRLGPFSIRTRICSSSEASPPMPEPTRTPMRSAFPSLIISFASSRASRAAATPNWAKRSMRLDSLRSMKSPGSKPLTSAPIFTS